MKKRVVSIFIALLLLVLVVGIASAAQPTGKKHLRFEGTMQAVENDEVLYPIIYVHGNGSGNATNLGDFTLHFEGIVSNDANGVGITVVAEHLTMANGDILFATGTGLGSPSPTPGVNNIVEEFTITGGTGQFENATGKYTIVRLIDLPTGVSSGTIEGKVKLSKDK